MSFTFEIIYFISCQPRPQLECKICEGYHLFRSDFVMNVTKKFDLKITNQLNDLRHYKKHYNYLVIILMIVKG